MKNIADVNSDDILSELNNLDYDDDLKLLDDEDIKPIKNNKIDDDLRDFYSDVEEISKPAKVDVYTEKEVKNDRPLDKFIDLKPVIPEPTRVATKTPKVESQIKSNSNMSNLDVYLNRQSENNPTPVKTVEPVIKPANYNKPSVVESQVKEIKPNVVETPVRENKVETNDINQLFNRVSNNVRGASEIVNKNSEIKRKIEAKFDELRRLQKEHEENKRKDYEEINKYKEEVYSMLQQKKSSLEKELAELKTEREKLANDRAEFENYKNSSLANLNKLEEELKNSYETRNRNIEQVEIGLVKRKEQLDNDRSNLAKEREQIEKDRAELANNLVQFNKLVDDFTNGIDNFN